MSCWLNKPIYGYGVWPGTEKEVRVDKKIFTLCPLTKDRQASIHIDLDMENIPLDKAVALINKFLSHLSWFCHQPYRQGDGVSGGVVKSYFDREQRVLFEGMIVEFPDEFELYDDDLVLRALAFHREAQVAEHYSLAYSCLSYYKILEIEKRTHGVEALNSWIGQKLPLIQEESSHIFPILQKKAAEAEQTLQEFFFKTIRNEAAHYLEDSNIILDGGLARELFGYAISPLRDLATTYIEEKLNISDHLFSRSWHSNSLYALEGQKRE